ncbi:MAG: OmpA family protein [Bacteroidota bacterium]
MKCFRIFSIACWFLLLSVRLVGQAETEIVPVEDNQTIIKSIFFGGGSSYIDEKQAAELRDFIYAVENINRYEVLVHSFTDNIGSKAYNQWLSQQRSEAVIWELEQLDIPIDLMLRADFGEENPIYSNRTFEGQLRNRRVDVILRPLSF